MSKRMHADVLVVGAGPVGLTLAIDLAQRGVSVTVAEMRAAGEPPVGRSNVVSARSMEAFRRLGIVRAVREAGCRPTILTMLPFAPRLPAAKSVASRSPAAPSAIRRKTVRTHGGRLRNRRIGSIRFFSSTGAAVPGGKGGGGDGGKWSICDCL
jgi:2-polyprenyl-6-methoxyphenol hydroxylase-like FAD-dependent oxidoreductase